MYALVLGVALAQSASPATLQLSATAINLNPSQQQVVLVRGATPPLRVVDQNLVTATADSSATTLTITATQATGSSVLHVTDATGASADIAVRVAFNAGTIVGNTTLTITGNPADPAWVAQEVADTVTRLTQALPGAAVSIGTVTPPTASLMPDQSEELAVPVQIRGSPQYFDQSGITTVTVQNLPLATALPTLLFYDDDPENVTQDGVLFRGSVSIAQPTRIYYYHAISGAPRRLVVALRASSAANTSVQFLAALPPPGGVPTVGQTLTDAFLPTRAQNEGLVVNLSGDEPYILADVPVTPPLTVAGTADIRVLSGGPVELTVLAVSPGVDPVPLLNSPLIPDDGHHRRGAFSIAPPYGADTLTFVAGGDDVSQVIPEATLSNVESSSTGRDFGDYGVLHTIDLTLENPGRSPATAYLFLQPSGSIANGSFLINGKIIDVGCVRPRGNPPANYQVTAFNLLPGQTYRTVVWTMVNGGSEPIEVGVTKTPPASVPPENAPDGCFPK